MKYWAESIFIKGRRVLVSDFAGSTLTGLPLSKKMAPEAQPGRSATKDLTLEDKSSPLDPPDTNLTNSYPPAWVKYWGEPVYVKGHGVVVSDLFGSTLTKLPMVKKVAPETQSGGAATKESTPEEQAHKAAASAEKKAETPPKWRKKQQAKKTQEAADGEQFQHSTDQELGGSDVENEWDLCDL
jgi:hypothetical protein